MQFTKIILPVFISCFVLYYYMSLKRLLLFSNPAYSAILTVHLAGGNLFIMVF